MRKKTPAGTGVYNCNQFFNLIPGLSSLRGIIPVVVIVIIVIPVVSSNRRVVAVIAIVQIIFFTSGKE